jgi:hypothetical protein
MFHNTTFIAQDTDSYMFHCILQTFLKYGFCPNVVQKGRLILYMEIKDLNLRFIRGNNYFSGDEIDLKKQFNLNIDDHFFPENLPFIENFEGQVPPLDYFLKITDTEFIKKKKENFVLNLSNYKWDYKKEVLISCENNVLILTMCCCNFIRECLQFETNLKKISNQLFLPNLLCPFGYQIFSISSYTYKLYKLLFLNRLKICAIKHEYGLYPHVSKIEYEWSCFKMFKNPEKNYIGAFNNPSGQKYFTECIPDLYSESHKEALFFNGCFFHGHYENCLLNKNATAETKTSKEKLIKNLTMTLMLN